MSGRNSFPENHRAVRGIPRRRSRAHRRDLDGHDFILVLGAPVFTYHVEGSGPHIPAGATLVQLIDDPAHGRVGAGRHVDRHASQAGRARAARCTPQPRGARRAAAARHDRARLPPTRLTDAYLLQQIAALRPPAASSSRKRRAAAAPMHDHLPIVEQDGFYTCASGGLGHGLAGRGRRRAGPARRESDRDARRRLEHVLDPGLWSAAQLGLPIAFVIVKNGRYEALNEFGRHFRHRAAARDRVAGARFLRTGAQPGRARDARGETAELDRALTAAFQSTQPILIEVSVERAAALLVGAGVTRAFRPCKYVIERCNECLNSNEWGSYTPGERS